MNAIARLTIKLAELSLRDLRPNPTDIAELHALHRRDDPSWYHGGGEPAGEGDSEPLARRSRHGA